MIYMIRKKPRRVGRSEVSRAYSEEVRKAHNFFFPCEFEDFEDGVEF